MNLDARPYRPRRSLVLYATYTYRRSSYPTPVVLHTVVVLEVVPSGTSVRFAAHVRARDAAPVVNPFVTRTGHPSGRKIKSRPEPIQAVPTHGTGP
jgi:hypothetical protein